MIPVTCAGHRLRFAEASVLANEAHTGLFVEDGFLDLRIPLSRLTSIDIGIKEALIPHINQYCDSIQGILIAFSHLRLLSPNVDLSETLGAFQDIRIHGTFVVFRPEPGMLLKGKVTRVTPYHMGCLVHRNFTASIDAENKTINFQEVYKTDQEMLFEAVRLENHSNICSIRGIVTSALARKHRPKRGSAVQDSAAPIADQNDFTPVEKVAKTKERGESDKVNNMSDFASATPDSGAWSAPSSITSSAFDETFSDTTTESQSTTKRKHKKRKRESVEEQLLGNMASIVLPEDPEIEVTSSPPKKKKKKKHGSMERDLASETSDMSIDSRNSEAMPLNFFAEKSADSESADIQKTDQIYRHASKKKQKKKS